MFAFSYERNTSPCHSLAGQPRVRVCACVCASGLTIFARCSRLDRQTGGRWGRERRVWSDLPPPNAVTHPCFPHPCLLSQGLKHWVSVKIVRRRTRQQYDCSTSSIPSHGPAQERMQQRRHTRFVSLCAISFLYLLLVSVISTNILLFIVHLCSLCRCAAAGVVVVVSKEDGDCDANCV